MKYFTKEQVKELREIGAVQHFDSVLNSNYKRGTTTRQDNIVADIYDEAVGIKISRNFSCKSCVFNLYRDAGTLYRNSLEYIKKENLRKAREAKAAKNKEIKNNENVTEGES